MESTGLYTNQTMILTGVRAADAGEAIRLLCGRAMENACIEPEFMTAILEREKEFPTGLPTAVPVAIPHIHDGCLRSFFSAAVLREPVAFCSMGDPDETIETRMVFLFGLTDPSYQTDVLKKFCSIFQDEETMGRRQEMEDPEKLMQELRGLLEEYLVTDF